MREFILKIESEGFTYFDDWIWLRASGAGLESWQYHENGEWTFELGRWKEGVEIIPDENGRFCT
jgi:hypothetical protein